MGRIARWAGVLGVLVLLAGTARGAIYEIDYASYDVKVTDSKGVVTSAQDFGFYTGPNILNARRGDAYVEIPFRKLKMIEVGTYIPSKGYYPASVTSRRGRVLKVQLERFEGQRYLGGETDVGTFRIRLGQIQKLELLKLSRTEGFD
ncbi:MAG: hypothetical protein ACC662_10750 [Planctomycetota bacterium]